MKTRATYTKEQLEAWAECDGTKSCYDCKAKDVCKGRSIASTIRPLAADLLSANEEIERLRKAFEPLTACSDLVWMNSGPETCIENGREEKDWCNGCKARNAFNKGDTHEA